MAYEARSRRRGEARVCGHLRKTNSWQAAERQARNRASGRNFRQKDQLTKGKAGEGQDEEGRMIRVRHRWERNRRETEYSARAR
jgi:hypothetical protein